MYRLLQVIITLLTWTKLKRINQTQGNSKSCPSPLFVVASINIMAITAVRFFPLDEEAQHLHQLTRRGWAGREPGVIVVWCIVFIVAVGLVSLLLYRRWMRKRAEKQAFAG
jgi:tryptophan-rich sensory protein